MNHRPTVRSLALCLLALLAIPTWARAQDQDPVDAKKQAARRARQVERNLDRETTHGMLRSHVAAMFATEPRRLPPGAVGDATIVLALQPQSVLRPGDHFALTYQSAQGPALLGAWRIDPAKPGLLDTALKGQLVYDNTATLRLPIQIEAGVEHGRHELRFVLECDVTDARSGEPHGRYAMDVVGYVEVGDPLPTPRIVTPSDGVSNGVTSEVVPSDGSKPVAAASDAEVVPDDPSPMVVSGETVLRRPVPGAGDLSDVPADRTAVDTDPVAHEPDRTGLWLALGVGSLGLAVMLLIGRRRH